MSEDSDNDPPEEMIDREAILRRIWDRDGVPKARQDELIAKLLSGRARSSPFQTSLSRALGPSNK